MAQNINQELEWLEKKALDIKEYVDDNPYKDVKDRTNKKLDRFGNEVIDVVQKIEVIQKSLRDSLKEYVDLIGSINKLREEEKKKEITARGSHTLNARQNKLVNK